MAVCSGSNQDSKNVNKSKEKRPCRHWMGRTMFEYWSFALSYQNGHRWVYNSHSIRPTVISFLLPRWLPYLQYLMNVPSYLAPWDTKITSPICLVVQTKKWVVRNGCCSRKTDIFFLFMVINMSVSPNQYNIHKPRLNSLTLFACTYVTEVQFYHFDIPSELHYDFLYNRSKIN